MFIVCFLVVFAACSISCFGAPTGLNIIPTADVLDRGQVSLEIGYAGVDLPWECNGDHFLLFQVGLGNGMEAGIDQQLAGWDVRANVKWRHVVGSNSNSALALGVRNIGESGDWQPYAVGSADLGECRAHAGIICLNGYVRPMAGFDSHIGARAIFQADHICGFDNEYVLGLALNVTSDLCLTIARSLGNSSQVEEVYIVNLAWSP